MNKRLISLLNITIMILLYPSFVSSADKHDGSDIRLQNNGWIRIENVQLENISPEVFYKDRPQMLMIHKEMVRTGSSRKDIGKLHVKLRYLKPCKATTRIDRMDIEPLSAKEEDIANQLILYGKYFNAGQKARADQVMSDMMNKYPDDYNEVLSDLTISKFNCGYQTTLYVTYLSSKGSEIKTDNSVAATAEKTNSGTSKFEMIPGDTAIVTFILPFDAKVKSWKVWVPK